MNSTVNFKLTKTLTFDKTTAPANIDDASDIATAFRLMDQVDGRIAALAAGRSDDDRAVVQQGIETITFQGPGKDPSAVKAYNLNSGYIGPQNVFGQLGFERTPSSGIQAIYTGDAKTVGGMVNNYSLPDNSPLPDNATITGDTRDQILAYPNGKYVLNEYALSDTPAGQQPMPVDLNP